MRPIRYIGRHRNAGHGYPLWLRLRRELAYWLRDRGRVGLGYLVDFDRDRYLDDLDDLDDDLVLVVEPLTGPTSDAHGGWVDVNPYPSVNGTGYPRDEQPG